MSLVGKFFVHMGEEYMQHGEIVAEVDSANILIKIDRCGHRGHMPERMCAIPIAKLISKITADGSIESQWDFFASRAELDAFLEWLDAPLDDSEHPVPEKSAALN